MRILGIDPGLDGALVLLEDRKIIDSVITPTIGSKGGRREYDMPGLIRLVNGFAPGFVAVEKQQPMPAKFRGSIGAFSSGFGYGMYVMLLTCLQLPYALVHPKTWQSVMLRDVNSKMDTKSRSLIVCLRLWPGVDWNVGGSSKNHTGKTDAALIAAYGEQLITGKTAESVVPAARLEATLFQ